MTDTPQAAAPPRARVTSFPVARVAGIEVRVHFSFLLLVALFAMAAPEPGITAALVSVGWLLSIFACVVIHEFAHCVVARRRGGQVHEILLFPLGGVSKLDRLPERPADEFAVAIVGPLMSLALAAGFAMLAVAKGDALIPIDLLYGGWFVRLAWLNLLLAAFNLLPAFPLDGGRVYRSLLERHLDLETATRKATRVGHGFAIALIVGGLFFDIWLVLIGIFVYFGASAEQAATIMHIRLAGHRVREVMRTDIDRLTALPSTDVVFAAPDDFLTDELVSTVATTPHREIAVMEANRLVGVLRIEDIQRFLEAARR